MKLQPAHGQRARAAFQLTDGRIRAGMWINQSSHGFKIANVAWGGPAQAADLKTGDAGRDAEMDEWEEIERYPDGQFTLDAVEPGGAGKFVARGRLRFHGVERDVSFPVTVAARRDTLTIAGSTSLDTRDYGLPVYRRFIIFRVDPVVQVKFRLVGKLLAP